MIEFNAKNSRIWSMLGASGVLGVAACELAEIDSEFVVITADLCYFSGLGRLNTKYPERVINVGIAEQNLIGVAAGMAKEGMNVFATTYATFASTRALDQVKVNMGYMGLPVKMIGLTSGFSAGILGATHMALEDIAILRSIPNLVILSPADAAETMKCLLAAAKTKVPTYIRMSGASRTPIVYQEDYDFVMGKAIRLKEGTEISLMATGSMVYKAIRVANLLEQKGYSCEVMNFHTIKPIDKEAIKKAIRKKLIVTIEEHSVIGGLGSAVSEVLAPMKMKPPQIMIGIEDRYPHAASYEALLENNGLTEERIETKILNCLMEK